MCQRMSAIQAMSIQDKKIAITKSFSPLARLRPGQSGDAPGGEERVTAGSRDIFWSIFKEGTGKLMEIFCN